MPAGWIQTQPRRLLPLLVLLASLAPPGGAEYGVELLGDQPSSNEPKGQLSLPFFWPLNSQRKHVKVQCVFTAAQLRSAGVPTNTPVSGVGLMVGRGEQHQGTALNGLRVGFRWMTDSDTANGLTVWGTSTTTFKFIASGGLLVSDLSVSPADLQAGSRLRMQFDARAPELSWDGVHNLMLEVSMENDQANLLSTALPRTRYSPTQYPCSLGGQPGATVYACEYHCVAALIHCTCALSSAAQAAVSAVLVRT